jgi:hypothetical protein
MELFLKGFLIPAAASLLATLLAALITAKLSSGLRAGAIVSVAVIAFFASIAAQLPVPQGVAPSQAPPASPAPSLARPVPQEGPARLEGRRQAGRIESPETKPIDTVPPRGPEGSEEDRFVQRYVAGERSGGGGPPRWAVLIAGDNISGSPALNSAVAGVLSERAYRRVAIFRPSLVQDRRYEEIYAADPRLGRQLRQYCDGIVVGIVRSSTPGRDVGLNGLLTVEMAVDMRVISTVAGDVKAEFRLQENGAGFTPTEAQSRAEERLASKVRDRLRTAFD